MAPVALASVARRPKRPRRVVDVKLSRQDIGRLRNAVRVLYDRQRDDNEQDALIELDSMLAGRQAYLDRHWS